MTTPEVPQPQIVAPTLEETRAINDSEIAQELRALAAEILKSSQLGFDPATAVKGIVTAFDFQGSPPTITVNIGGDASVEVSDVRIINTYSPEVGHTVLLIKQGSQIFALGHLADLAATTVNSGSGGWVRADLSNGSHGANSNGDIYYRRVLDHGSWKMQWRGGWTPSGEFMIDTAKALPEEYRPTSLRSLLAARQFSTGAIACQVDFTSDGRVRVTGMTQNSGNIANSGGDVHSVSLSTGSTFAGSTVSHSHGGAVALTTITHGSTHSHGMSHDHGFTGGSHSHTVSTPTWVSLNGVSYFI